MTYTSIKKMYEEDTSEHKSLRTDEVHSTDSNWKHTKDVEEKSE